MKPFTACLDNTSGLILMGEAAGAAGIYIGNTDETPGAALIGLLVMIIMLSLGVRTALGGRITAKTSQKTQ